MGGYMGLLEKDGAVLAGEQLLVSEVDLSICPTAEITEELTEVDKRLENTLFSTAVLEQLTKREIEILKLIVSGSTNKEIAAKLYRSERTIEYHRHRLMQKIGTNRSADLVRRAIALGL